VEAALREAHDALAGANRDLEQRVAERTADLTAANVELERFAYIASHDLRAPLRALLTIPDWLRETLAESYGAVLPAIEDDLREMEVQSQRMDRLLSDLLTYARIGQSGDASAWIDPAALIRDSAGLVGRTEGFSVEIRGELPRVFCIPAEFALIMRNLISNAVKHHDRDTGRITVSGRLAGETAIIEVRDDGPGIDRKYAEKVFEMFSTLKPRDEVEGSGMGLAMVKKIMERAGGYVRLGGTDGERGAVLELAFPAAEAGIQSEGGKHVQDTAGRRQSLLGAGLQPETRNLG
jgi:signal transduction histidine kinase